MAEQAEGSPNTSEMVAQISDEVLDKVWDQVDKRLSGVASDYESALEDAQNKAATKVEEKGTELVAKLTEKVSSAEESLNGINSIKTSADQALALIDDHGTKSKTVLDTVNQNRDAVVSLGERTEELNDDINAFQERIRTVNEELQDHTTDWNEKFDEIFTKIEELLPGATGAGLASGFLSEKKAYEEKHRSANRVFIFFLLLLVITIGFTPLRILVGELSLSVPSDFYEVLKRMLWNLPIVVPAVWGAWWFNRRASLYDQLAEEYRQKEVISKTFDGYTKQLTNIESDKDEVLAGYLKGALREICIPAGRVYDKKMPAATPWEDQFETILTRVMNKTAKGDSPMTT